MRAVLQQVPGEPAELSVGEAALPEPLPGEVRIRVEACGINPVDWKLSRGSFPGWQWPHTPGIDIVGTVDAAGDAAGEHLIGLRIAAHHNLARQGGLAEAVSVGAALTATLPQGMDAARAAAVPCPALTAHQCVTRTGVAAGQRVLVTGAGGAVGTFAVQLAIAAGAEVFASASGRDLERLRLLGVAEAVDYKEPAAPAMMSDWAGDGFDTVLDLIGDGSKTAALVGYSGAVASTVGRPDLSAVPPFSTVPAAVEIALGAVYSNGTITQRAALGERLGELLQGVADGALETSPMTVVGFDDVPGIWAELDRGGFGTKVIATP